MSGPSQHQNVFRIAKPDVRVNRTQPQAMKRNRQPVSCLACRTRKLKCDRQSPCHCCSKRGDSGSCSYTNGSRTGRDQKDEGSKTSEAQIRLQKLEETVTSFMRMTKEIPENHRKEISSYNATINQHLKHLSINSSPRKSQTCSRGQLDVHDSEISYHDDTHWATILRDIRDIQDVLEPGAEESEEVLPSATSNAPDIVFDTTQSLTLADVRKYLPPRARVNKLLSVYFNAKYTQIPIIHNGKFVREYESFWIDPSPISFLWISMLFSMLYIASQIDEVSGRVSADYPSDPIRPRFLTIAGQALVTGKYHTARPHSVEAVLLYAYCKYVRKEDPDLDAWMTVGISARLAMRLGYHRDPNHLANIPPFEGEMRRRTFFFIQTFDLLLSFQAGLPTIVHEEDCDVEPPSNLFDTDFDEDYTSLPPSRPSTDQTPMLYYIVKGRLMKIFRRVIRHALSLKPPAYEVTMNLDNELHQFHMDVPSILQVKPLSSSFTDEPYIILNRLNIDIMYQKSLCVLHRRYLSHDRSDPKLDYSRKTCSDAALQILDYQGQLHIACQPEGQLHNDRWMLASLTTADFLLAAMIACLDLYLSHSRPTITSQQDWKAQVTKYDALRFSHDIWASRRASSRDARRALNALAVMLSRVPRPTLPSTPISITSGPFDESQASSDGGRATGTAEGSWGSTSWNLAETNILGQDFNMEEYTHFDFYSADPLNAIFSNSDCIDWGLVDQALLEQSNDGNSAVD